MNILITRFPYESALGGEEWHTIELAKELRKRGHSVVFMGSCPVLLELFKKEGFEAKKTWGGKMAVTPFELIKFIFFSPIIFCHLKRIFQKLVKKYNINRLYCLSLNEKILLTPMAKKMKIKTIWVEHQQIRNWLMMSPLRFLYKKNSSFATIVPISPWNKKMLEVIGLKRVVDIPNGVKKINVKKIKKENTVVGIIARLIEKKGVGYVTQAAKKFSDTKTKKKITFIIVGEGPERKTLEEEIRRKKINNIIFTGRLDREQYEKTFASFDIFILPSVDESETFGLVVAEAMLLGIPTIITNVCGIAKYLRNGKNTLIIPPRSPEKIIEAITQLTDKKELAESIALNAKKTAEKKFLFEKMVNQYEKIFQ